MPTQLQPLEITGSARSPANSALGLGSSHPLRSPYYKFDYTTYGQLADGGGARSGSSSAAGDRQRKSAPRRTVERVVHERAPALATLVAGHGDGGLKQAAKDVRDRAINAAAKGKANRNGKRYSTQEINHLVPDETGVLHDPEYESFRIIQPSAQNSQYSGSVNGHADDDEHSQSASSSDTEEDEEAATARQRQAELMNGKTSLPASQLAKRPGVGSRHGTDPTSPRPSRSYRVTTASNGTSFRNTPSHPHTSGLGALVSANRSTTPSIRSQSSGSDQASRLGPRSGNGVTYLAPSITMPPAASSYQSIATIQAQAYNPVRDDHTSFESRLAVTNVLSDSTHTSLPHLPLQKHTRILQNCHL